MPVSGHASGLLMICANAEESELPRMSLFGQDLPDVQKPAH